MEQVQGVDDLADQPEQTTKGQEVGWTRKLVRKDFNLIKVGI